MVFKDGIVCFVHLYTPRGAWYHYILTLSTFSGLPLATSTHTDRPARRRAHKRWKQQQKQQQQFVSMTQKQDVWYEVLQGDETSPAAASSSSKDAFWVEHRRSPQESQQFRQQQKAHRPPVKQQTSVAGVLWAVAAGTAGADASVSWLG
jgi:hypothetical protein